VESKRVALCRCLIKTIKYVGSAMSSFATADSYSEPNSVPARCPSEYSLSSVFMMDEAAKILIRDPTSLRWWRPTSANGASEGCR
jgi:hypothetical protein